MHVSNWRLETHKASSITLSRGVRHSYIHHAVVTLPFLDTCLTAPHSLCTLGCLQTALGSPSEDWNDQIFFLSPLAQPHWEELVNGKIWDTLPMICSSWGSQARKMKGKNLQANPREHYLSELGAAIKQKDWNLSWLIDLSKVECCWNSSFKQLLKTPCEQSCEGHNVH